MDLGAQLHPWNPALDAAEDALYAAVKAWWAMRKKDEETGPLGSKETT